MRLHADASFFIALARTDDRYHAEALALAHETRRHRLSTHALAEVVALVGPHLGGRRALDAHEAIRDNADVHLPEAEELDEAMGLVVRHDGRLSLSDALFVLLMEREKGASILSFDAAFDRAGVTRLSKPRKR